MNPPLITSHCRTVSHLSSHLLFHQAPNKRTHTHILVPCNPLPILLNRTQHKCIPFTLCRLVEFTGSPLTSCLLAPSPHVWTAAEGHRVTCSQRPKLLHPAPVTHSDRQKNMSITFACVQYGGSLVYAGKMPLSHLWLPPSEEWEGHLHTAFIFNY